MAKKKTKKKAAAPDFVVKSKCKEALKEAGCNVAGDALDFVDVRTISLLGLRRAV